MIAGWFESMNFPFPVLNAYLATITEGMGVILLILGLGTRIISVPLMITMLVAIFTVHYANGFAAGDNCYEIPFYYLLMLFTLFILGPGRISVDYLIGSFRGRNK
jgi:putative oxidoreductase